MWSDEAIASMKAAPATNAVRSGVNDDGSQFDQSDVTVDCIYQKKLNTVY